MSSFRDVFNGLFNWVKDSTGETMDQYLTDSNQSVTETFAAISSGLGVSISTTNISGRNAKPQITNITSSNANGSYIAGSTITIVVSFSVSVTISGVPRMLLNTTPSRYANYSSGSGTKTINFTYVVQTGDISLDLDYVSTSSLELNGSKIKSVSNINAVLTLPAPGSAHSLGANKNIEVNGVVKDWAAESITIVIRTMSNLISGTWSSSTKQITQTGAFANYDYQSGDLFKIDGYSGPAAVTLGYYPIQSKVDNNSIQFYYSLGTNGAANITGKLVTQEVAYLLANILTTSLGCTTTVSTSPSLTGINVYVGRSSRIDTFGLNLNTLDDEGYVITGLDPSNYVIAGNTSIGTEFGVYEFLERYLGVVWLMPDSASLPASVQTIIGASSLSGTEIPTYSSLEVPLDTIREEPVFKTRHSTGYGFGNLSSYSEMATEIIWSRHNRHSSRLASNHNINNLLPPTTPNAGFAYSNGTSGFFASNPEYYANSAVGYTPDAYASNWNPDFTESGTITAVVNNLKSYFDASPHESGVSISLGDNETFDNDVASVNQTPQAYSFTISGTTLTFTGNRTSTFVSGRYMFFGDIAGRAPDTLTGGISDMYYAVRKIVSSTYNAGSDSTTVVVNVGFEDRTAGQAGAFSGRGSQSYTWTAVNWGNQIVAALNATTGYENKKLAMLAYRSMYDPPDIPTRDGSAAISVNANLCIALAFESTRWIESTVQREFFKSWVQRWYASAPLLGLYDYIYGDGYLLPRLLMSNFQEYLLFTQNYVSHWTGEHHPNWIEGPKGYIIQKLLWNPSRSINDLITTWCSACVGSDAGVYLTQFYQLWDSYWNESNTELASTSYVIDAVGSYLNFRSTEYMECSTLHSTMISARTLMNQCVNAAVITGGVYHQRALALENLFDFYEMNEQAFYPKQLARTSTTANSTEIETVVDVLVDGLDVQQSRYTWDSDHPRSNLHVMWDRQGVWADSGLSAETSGNRWHRDAVWRLIPHAAVTLSVAYSSQTVKQVLQAIQAAAATDYPDFSSIVTDTIYGYIAVVNGTQTNIVPCGGFEQISVSVANWTDSSRTLTETNAFTNFVYSVGAKIVLTAGTGVIAGTYTITSKISNNAITLSADITAGNADVSDNSIVGTIFATLSGSSAPWNTNTATLDTTTKRSGARSVRFSGTSLPSTSKRMSCPNMLPNDDNPQNGTYIVTGYAYCTTLPAGELTYNIITRTNTSVGRDTPITETLHPVANEWVAFGQMFTVNDSTVTRFDWNFFNRLETGDDVWLDDLAIYIIQ